MMNRMILQYVLLKTAMKLLAAIPRKTLTRLAYPIGKLWYALDRRHRGIAAENMRIAFGHDWDQTKRNQWVKANFIQLSRLALEMPSLLKLKARNLDDYVTFSGLEGLNAIADSKQPVMLLTAHMGNWELMALAWALKTKRRCHVIARPLDYAPMGRIINEIRSAAGNRVIDKDNSRTMISRVLRKKESVGILLDQNASWFEGVYVPFFGQLACTNKGLALFALRYDALVVPGFNFRQPDGRYKIVIEPPLQLTRTGNINEDIMTNTERFNRIIEKYIRKAPDNWLWVHRRWRIINIPESHRRKFDAAVERYPLAFKGTSPDDRYGNDQ